jgi:hypothetical protein
MNMQFRAVGHRCVWAAWLILAACGGGSGGGGGAAPANPTPPPSSYANVQPPPAPASEVADHTRASGIVTVAPDPLDTSARRSGVPVELAEIQPGGALGPVVASGLTTTEGRFDLAMPAGASTTDGKWLITARPQEGALRGYVHSGAMRIDVGSEAWVRQVAASAGKLLVFAGADAATLKSICRALVLFADATGEDYAGLALDVAADQIVRALSGDHAMSYVRTTLAGTGALPAAGVGDIGAFSALSASYIGRFVDRSGTQTFVAARPLFSSVMAADGTWEFEQKHYDIVDGRIGSPTVGVGGTYRLTPSRLNGIVQLSGLEGTLLSNAIGQFSLQSFPLQAGARQLDARRIESTGLNFSGGSDDQPISFSSIERVEGIEVVAMAAGPTRAVKVVGDVEIGFPSTTPGGVTRVVLRSTVWQVPGVGVVKALDQLLENGVLDTSTADETHELLQAWANDRLWPHRVTFTRSFYPPGTRCAPVAVQGARRVISDEFGPPLNASPTLALSLRDVPSGAQIGVTRTFSGFLGPCPTAAGTSGNVFVTEAFLDRRAATTWPASQSAAANASDVIHEVSGTTLQDVASYALAPMADASQPSLYWPAVANFVSGAPDATRRLVVGSNRLNAFGGPFDALFAQVLGPAQAGPRISLGSVQLNLADWTGGRLFTWESFGQSALRVTPFNGNAIDTAGTRDIKIRFGGPFAWYASGDLLFLVDGSSVRVSDGSNGPSLGLTSSSCGLGAGELICLDQHNDELLRFDPSNWTRRSVVPMGSYLRSLSAAPPDFTQLPSFMSGVHVWDSTTFTIGDHDVHVGGW